MILQHKSIILTIGPPPVKSKQAAIENWTKMPNPAPLSSNESVTTTFRVRKAIFNRFLHRLPKRGDRSKLLQQLVEDFLDGKITVVVPPRKF